MRRMLAKAGLALAVLLAAAAPAAASTYANNGYSIAVQATPSDRTISYHVQLTDPFGKPASDARVALVGRVNGAEYRVSGDPSQTEARAMLKPQSEAGVHHGEVTFPEKGIWKMQLAVVVPQTQQLLAQVEFEESVGGVWTDQAKGLAMFGALVGVIALYYAASFRRRTLAVRK